MFILLQNSEYVGEWDSGDNPLTEHRNLFPHCPFMRGQDVGNVPIMAAGGGEGDSADSDIDPTSGGGAGRHDQVGSLSHVNYTGVVVGYRVTICHRRNLP